MPSAIGARVDSRCSWGRGAKLALAGSAALLAVVYSVMRMPSGSAPYVSPSGQRRSLTPSPPVRGEHRGWRAPAPADIPSARLPESKPSPEMETAREADDANVFGHVFDALGGPIEGAVVTLLSAVSPAQATRALSDANGAFSGRAPEGDVRLMASADGYSTVVQRTRAPAVGLRLALAPGAQIVGHVLRAGTEAAVVGARVIARSIEGDTDFEYATTSTGDGEFRIDSLPGGGAYEVLALGPSWRSQVQWTTLDVGHQSDPIVLLVKPAGVLRASVRRGDEACPGATVSASGPAGGVGHADGAGQVELGGLLPGSYQVVVHCPRALTHREELTLSGELVHRDWNLAPGLAIQGRVLGPQRMPIADAVVSVRAVNETRAADQLLPSQCTTDADGKFSCGGLRPGNYDCRLADSNEPQPDAVRVALGDGPSSEVELTVGPWGTLRVFFAETTGNGAREPRVFARRALEFPVQGRPLGGGAVFERLPLGRYTVYAAMPAEDGDIEIELREHGQELEVQLRSPRASSIAGRAVDANGLPWIDAWVSASASDDVARSATADDVLLTDDQGRFSFGGLAPGAYDVIVRNHLGQAALRGVKAGATGVVVRRLGDVELEDSEDEALASPR